MHQFAEYLGRTGHIQAFGDGFSVNPKGRFIANWTTFWHLKNNLVSRSLFKDHMIHFGNHIASFLDHHLVADADILGPDIVLVMKGGTSDHRSRQRYWRQFGHRGQGAGAAYLNGNGFHGSNGLVRSKLIGHRPAGAFCGVPQQLPTGQFIDLDDQTVDFKGQVSSFHFHQTAIVNNRFDIVKGFDRTGFKTQGS